MIYINYRSSDSATVDTVEAVETMKEARLLMKDYRLICSGYYTSSRASKEYYEALKNKA